MNIFLALIFIVIPLLIIQAFVIYFYRLMKVNDSLQRELDALKLQNMDLRKQLMVLRNSEGYRENLINKAKDKAILSIRKWDLKNRIHEYGFFVKYFL